MKRNKKLTGLFLAAMLFVSACLVMPAAAAGDSSGDGNGHAKDPSKMLDRLDEKGLDTTEVRAAIESGDRETARELLKALIEEAGLERPDGEGMGDGTGPGGGAGPAGLLDKLDEAGFDTTEVRSAIESGDKDTARELMKALMEEAGFERPEGDGTGPRGGAGERSFGEQEI